MYLAELGYVQVKIGAAACKEWERWNPKVGPRGYGGTPLGACVRLPDSEIARILRSRAPLTRAAVDWWKYPDAQSMVNAGHREQFFEEVGARGVRYGVTLWSDQGRAGRFSRTVWASPEHQRRAQMALKWGRAVKLLKDNSGFGWQDAIPLVMMAVPFIAVAAAGAGAGAAAAGGASGTAVTSASGAAVTSASGAAVTSGAGVAAGTTTAVAASTAGATGVGMTAKAGAPAYASQVAAAKTVASGAAATTAASGAGITAGTVTSGISKAATVLKTAQQAKAIYEQAKAVFAPAANTDPAFMSPGDGYTSWGGTGTPAPGMQQYIVPGAILGVGILAAIMLAGKSGGK